MTKSVLTPLEEELLTHINNMFKMNEYDKGCTCERCELYTKVKESLSRLSPETDIEMFRRQAG